MWALSFYRLYISIACGLACGLIVFKSIWLAVLFIAVTRALIWVGESAIKHVAISKGFKIHAAQFKQLYGPYGIRIINKAETDGRVRSSLFEVFTSDTKALAKSVEQLEVMETLFKAGMQPQGDDFLLHDLKLKFGKFRLEKEKPVS